MRFKASIEIYGKVVEVECDCSDIGVYAVTYDASYVSDFSWRGVSGEHINVKAVDLSDMLRIRHVEEELHRQFIDYKENLKQGV